MLVKMSYVLKKEIEKEQKKKKIFGTAKRQFWELAVG